MQAGQPITIALLRSLVTFSSVMVTLLFEAYGQIVRSFSSASFQVRLLIMHGIARSGRWNDIKPLNR